MCLINTLIDFTFLFLFSSAILFFLRKLALHPKIALIDRPNNRKLHKGSIPLVGGISICLSLLYFLHNNPHALPHSVFYSFSIILLVMIGALDDKYDISFKIRLVVQAGLAILMLFVTGTQLASLGNIFGFGALILPDFIGNIITILAVIGAINAFNMVDGIDGLLGGLSSITFSGLGFLFLMNSMPNYAYFCAVLIVVIVPYILFNLSFFGHKHKVFMGDAGSMLIGFTVVFLLISATQPTSEQEILRPVTALWLIAIPLIDMIAIMYRRIRRGDSPFKPDREHLHHIFQRIGFNSIQTLISICALSLLCASVGIFGEIYNISESFMFYLFMSFTILYVFLLSNIWKVVKRIRSFRAL